jgi:hypothetical protein
VLRIEGRSARHADALRSVTQVFLRLANVSREIEVRRRTARHACVASDPK